MYTILLIDDERPSACWCLFQSRFACVCKLGYSLVTPIGQ